MLTRVFGDPSVTKQITYRLFRGMTTDHDGNPVADYHDFSLTALIASTKTSAQQVRSGVSLSALSSGFVVRPEDFPAGVTVDDLTPSDMITYDGKDHGVQSINRSIPFVVQISIVGQ